jgi:hypothetical protein
MRGMGASVRGEPEHAVYDTAARMAVALYSSDLDRKLDR